MRIIQSKKLADLVENTPAAIKDDNGKWVGVLLTKSNYQLLMTMSELVNNPKALLDSVAKNANIRSGDYDKEQTITFEEMFAGRRRQY